jgi:hypothetical protein
VRKGRSAPRKDASTNNRDAYKNTTHLDGSASIPFPEIAVELGIPEREVLRWATARARGKSFRSSPAYRAYAIEVERRYRVFDWTLYCTSEKYRDAIFNNAKRGAA